jgi:hexosaminidase
VLVEFDTPGHAQSWSKGAPEMISKCYDRDGRETGEMNMVDPTKETTWDTLLALFQVTRIAVNL